MLGLGIFGAAIAYRMLSKKKQLQIKTEEMRLAARTPSELHRFLRRSKQDKEQEHQLIMDLRAAIEKQDPITKEFMVTTYNTSGITYTRADGALLESLVVI